MRRVIDVLKCREAASECERQQAQRAALIRRRDHHPAARRDQSRQSANERAWILQMLDHLDGDGDVRTARRKRDRLLFHIRDDSALAHGKPRIGDQVNADVAIEAAL